MKKKWWDEAWDSYLEYSQIDKRIFKKINNLIKDIDRNGYNGIGHSEPLKGNLSGWHSVEIDDKNRLVFRVEDNTIEIMQCGTHYNNK